MITLPNGYKVDIGNDPELFYVIHEIFYKSVYGVLSIRRGDVVLDCGANVGIFTLYVLKRCSFVVCVEPIQNNFHLLQRNIRLNGLQQKTIIVKKALHWHSDLPIQLYWTHSGAWSSLYPDEGQKAYHIEISETITVDDLVNA